MLSVLALCLLFFGGCNEARVIVFCPFLEDAARTQISVERLCKAYRMGINQLFEENEDAEPYSAIELVWGDSSEFHDIYRQVQASGASVLEGYIKSKDAQALLYCDISEGPVRSQMLYSTFHLFLESGHATHKSDWKMIDDNSCYSPYYWRAEARIFLTKLKGAF